MSRARNLANLLDANGDVASGALDNVPPSNDASALTTGTLPIARIADGDITAAKLGSTLDLSGKTVTLPSGIVGKVGRIVNATTDSDISVGTSATIVESVTITPMAAGSSFIVQPTLNFSQAQDYDTDFGMAMGYKIGGYSSTVNDYTQFGGNTGEGNRERPNGWYPWWSTDVIPNQMSSQYPYGYHTFQYAWSRQVTPTYTLGDSITFLMIVQADKTGIFINRGFQSAANGGGLSSITVTEVMP